MANTYQFVSRTSQSASVATTVVVTSGAGQAIPRRSIVVLRFANSSGVLPSSVVDSAGHTYSLATSATNGATVGIYYCVTTHALPAGATFTANVAATSSSRMLDVSWCSRPGTQKTSTVLDTAATNGTGVASATGTSTAAATAAFSSGQANSLFVSAVADAGAASSTPAASWTEDSDVQVTAAVLHMETQTRIETAITSTAASSTLASSVAWAMCQACFKLAAPIAYVKTAQFIATSSSATTFSATVTQNAAIGDHILVRMFTGGLNPASACTDSAGNTYIRDDTGTYGGTGADYALFRSKLTVAHVAATTTITVTGGTTPVFYAGDAIKVTGATTITRGEFTTSAEGTGTTVASPTIIPVTANWIALGGIDSGFTSATPGTTGGTWVEDTDTQGTETQTLISTTFPQSAVGFSATITPTQTFIDLGWNLLQVDKPVVEIESVTGSSATSKTETFRAATAGDLLLLIVGTNENAGADNVTTPTGWTLLAQSRSGTTNVNLNLYGKIAVGGETSVLATGSATARIQTAFANMGQGYSLTIDVSNTANSTSASLTGAVGSVTPVTAGGIAISAIAFKNAETTVVAGPANSTPYDQLGVNNEGSTASTQKVTVAWWYSENVVTTLAYNNAPVATGTSAPYAGLNVVLQAAPTNQTVPLQSASSTSTGTLALTAATQVPLASASSISTAVLALAASTQLQFAAASSVSSGSLALSAPAIVVLQGAASTSSGAAAVTAATQVPLQAGASTSTGTLAPSAQTTVGLQSAASTSTGSAALSAQTTVPLAAGASTSTGTAAVSAATAIPLGSASSTSSGGNVTFNSFGVTIPLAAGSSTSAGTLALTAATQIPLAAGASTSSATLALTAATKIPLAAGASTSTGTVVVTAATQVPLASGSSTTTSTLAVRATTTVPLASSASTSAGTANVSAATVVALSGASSASSGTAAVSAATQVPLAAGSSTSAGTVALTAATQIPLAAGSSTSTPGALGLSANGQATIPLAPAASTTTSTLALTAATQVQLAASTSSTSGSATLTAATKIALGAASSTSTAGALGLTAATTVPLAPGSSTSSATLALSAATQVPLAPGASTTTSTLAVSAATQVPLAPASSTSTPGALGLSSNGQATVPLAPASSSTTAGTLALSAAAVVGLGAGASSTTGAATLRAQTTIPLGAGNSTSSGSVTLSIGSVVIPLAVGASTTTATLALRAQTRVTLAPATSTTTGTAVVSVGFTAAGNGPFDQNAPAVATIDATHSGKEFDSATLYGTTFDAVTLQGSQFDPPTQTGA